MGSVPHAEESCLRPDRGGRRTPRTLSESLSLPSERKTLVAEEIGDVLLYLIRLADKLGIDPIEAAQQKLERNAEKYPVSKSRGSSKKYTEL